MIDKHINTIINGNSIEVMNSMPPSSVDMVFADPPYWMRVEGKLLRTEGTEFDGCSDAWDQFTTLEQYEAFTRDWLSACKRILKPTGSIWVIGGMQCIYTMGAIMQQLGFWLINDVIWHKTNPTPNFMGTRLNNSHETLLWACKSKTAKFTFNYKTAKEVNTDSVSASDFARGVRKQLGSVWRFPVCTGLERIKDDRGEKLHSTQKPQKMLERIISIATNRGDTVLDPFGGTMTTAAAAKMLGRRYIMIEQEARYCVYGQRRLADIEYIETPIARAIFDVKPLKASMVDMIQAGYFYKDESFCFKDGVEVTKLTTTGKLLYNGAEVDMHTCAALARKVKAKRLNGFDYWYVWREGELKSIAEIREIYRNQVSKAK